MSRTNPYEKYLGREDVMQAEIVRLISFQYPELFWWHTPNEGKRTDFEQYKFKKLGGQSGVSDFVILDQSVLSKGLMMEIKCGRNKCTKSQVDFLITSIRKGYNASVVYDSASDAFELIQQHLGNGICSPEKGIILIKKGQMTFVPLEKAHEILIVKKQDTNPDKEKTDKKALFAQNAIKRYGKPLDSGKLFKKVG